MSAFLYGLALQWKLDIRSKAMLITCYLIPLVFYVFLGGIFTSLTPESKNTMIQGMSIFGVSMGALVGFPSELMEVYSSSIKKVYKANGVSIMSGVLIHFLSSFIHLFLMSMIIFVTAPFIFDSALPSNLPAYFGTLIVFIATTLSIGCIFGLLLKDQAKLTMFSQIAFMPSIMLSGIMFPVKLLPNALIYIGKIFPASWAFEATTSDKFNLLLWLPMIAILLISFAICAFLLSKKRKD